MLVNVDEEQLQEAFKVTGGKDIRLALRKGAIFNRNGLTAMYLINPDTEEIMVTSHEAVEGKLH